MFLRLNMSQRCYLLGYCRTGLILVLSVSLGAIRYLGNSPSGVTADNLGEGVNFFYHGNNQAGGKSGYGMICSFIGGNGRGVQFDLITVTSSVYGVTAGEVWKRNNPGNGWSAWAKMG